MKKLLAILVLIPTVSTAYPARLFTRANNQKITNSTGTNQGNSYTLAVWFKFGTAPGNNVSYEIVSDGGGWGEPAPRLMYNNNSGTPRIYYATSNTFGVYNEYWYNTTLTTGAWAHVAVTKIAGASPILYVNGSAVTWTQDGGGTNLVNQFGGTFGIGCLRWDSDQDFYDGDIAEIGRWCQVGTSESCDLSANEIKALYRGVPMERVRPTVTNRWFWRLEGLESPERDYGPKRTTGTLGGAAGTPVRSNHPPIIPRGMR